MQQPTLVREFREFDDIADDLDFVFNNYFKVRRWALTPADKGWKPATDMYETDQEVVIVIDIAGISIQDISLHLFKNILTIRGMRKEQFSGCKRHFHKMEIDFGQFERFIELPSPVDTDKVSTKYLNGFFEVHFLKKEQFYPNKIEIAISGGKDE